MDPRTREVLQIDLVLELIASRAVSSLGRDYVQSLQPLERLAEVEEHFAPIRDLIALQQENQDLPLGGLSDITEHLELARVEGAVLEEPSWAPIRGFLELSHRSEQFRESRARKYPALATLLSPVLDIPELRLRLLQVFDDHGRVSDNASPGLYQVRRSLRNAEQRIQRLVTRLAADYHQKGYLQENYSTLRNGRHVFPVKASSKSRVGGIFHGTSATAETIYLEPSEVVEASNEVESLREAERLEVFLVLQEITKMLRSSLNILRGNQRTLRIADGMNAIARVAHQRGWNIPIVVEEGTLRLFNAHHPILNLGGNKSIPITMILDRGDRCVILSGPNAGGKTTAMKTVGLLAYLVLCGCPIPAYPDSTIPRFASILADIGDQQDIQQGISTFSGHIRRIRDLWNRSGPRTLVLLDELGTGTDPQEGGALALALMESFHQRAGLTITTSHLNPVKQWAEDTTGARNASFSLDPSTHEPTFVLRLDLPGASEALEIAEREGLPATVLVRARELVGERHLRMGELLRRIEERERTLSIAARDAEVRAKSLAEQESLARARAESLRNERREYREQALREKEQAIAQAREKIERLIATLPSEDDLARRREALVRAREEALRDQVGTQEERRRIAIVQVERGDFCKGQRVYIRDIRQWGEITTIDQERERARVLVGRLEMPVKFENLLDHDPAERREEHEFKTREMEANLSGQRRSKKSRRVRTALRNATEITGVPAFSKVTLSGNVISNISRPNSMNLDLHGFRVEEALSALDKFLDQALLASFPYVKVCHGTGTGKLYRAVHDFLRQHRSVKKYRFGTPDEGGGGITIVDL